MKPTEVVETKIEAKTDQAAGASEKTPQDYVLEELLIQEISIDGMCGVY